MIDLLEAYLDEHAPSRYSQEMEDHFSITRVEPGKLWLEAFVSGEREIGPVPVPTQVSRLCKVGEEELSNDQRRNEARDRSGTRKTAGLPSRGMIWTAGREAAASRGDDPISVRAA